MSKYTFLLAGAGATAFTLASVESNADALTAARLAVCGAALGIAAAVDVAEHRVPNRVVLPAAAVCIALSLVGGTSLRELAGGLALVALLLVLSLVRSAALGMGDVKLALVIAVGLDGSAPRALLLGLLLAALVGLMILALRGRPAWHRALPLAPFLAAGALAALLL